MGELLRRELRRVEVEEDKGRRKDWSRGEGRRRVEEDSETLVSAISEIPKGRRHPLSRTTPRLPRRWTRSGPRRHAVANPDGFAAAVAGGRGE